MARGPPLAARTKLSVTDPNAPLPLDTTIMPPRVATLIGYGALAAILLFVAIFALIAYVSIPRSTGGIDGTEATVTWISVGLVVVALIAVHVLIGRELLAFGRGTRRPIESYR